MSNTFQNVASLHPGRSVFNLSYQKKLTADMGQLIPIMADEMVPGDSFTIGNEIVVRMQPMVAPILHEINLYTHYFFVPYRILWDDWEEFITGGVDGEFAETIPLWEPTALTNVKYSLWDYFGFPTGVIPVGAYPIDFPRRAYNLIYNEFYRDETNILEVDLDNEEILIRSWEKDYFTSALPWQQRGTAPALPISGLTKAVFPDATVAGDATISDFRINLAQSAVDLEFDLNSLRMYNALNNNSVDLSEATTFDISTLRLAFQIQKWLERNARAGARYTEFLQVHFGVHPRDERLQRPEYIGGTKQPIIISEVLQTSETSTSPQGNLAGHGISVNSQFAGKYFAQEFGIVVGIMSIMPRSAYQQGINRQWLRRTKYDFYFAEFANLSEQAIERAEIYASGVEEENKTIFGYQGRYDEMRVKNSMVVADMRDTFDYWHLGRKFATAPVLNQSFLECVPRKDIFAVTDEPGFIVNVANLIKAVRPLPVQSNPGLVDHN